MISDQDQILEDASNKAKTQAFYMKKALDNTNLREALKCCSSMLAELKTSLLTPRNYYTLYMQIFDELKFIETQFLDEAKKGRKMGDLYEIVQHANAIIPRLYLLITVGSVRIANQDEPPKEILNDVLEMVKGVQFPMRGLFLRYYLLKCMKDRLPDENKEGSPGGDINDSIDFILTNLTEMNRLWIRMQHSGIKDKSMREAERNELRVTVGENVIRLANLEGIKLPLYTSRVLPALLDIIKGSKDAISQQYLMDCIIQAFPDEFHLHTLDNLLEACTCLHQTVDVKTIFINFMDRLAQYASTPDNQIETVNKLANIFKLFKKYIDKLVQESATNMDAKKMLELQVAFLKFTIKSYPMNTDYVNEILESCMNIIELQRGTLDHDSLKHLVKLLSIPLETLSLAIFSMSNYPPLMAYLQPNMRKTVAKRIVLAVQKSGQPLQNLDLVSRLFEFINPLVLETEGEMEEEAYEFEETQVGVTKLIHLLNLKDIPEYWKMLQFMKEKFELGGTKRMKYTMPAIIFASLRLSRIADGMEPHPAEFTQEEIFLMCQKLIAIIAENYPMTGFGLYLQCVLAINFLKQSKTKLENLAYDFLAEALTVYEDEVTEIANKMASMNLIVATLQQLTFFSEENYDTLASNVTQYSAKMLKKPDQFKAVTHCLHLFQMNQGSARIAEIFKKLNKIWNICKGKKENSHLQVLFLNKLLYFAIGGDPSGDKAEINHMIGEITQVLTENKDNPTFEEMKSYFEQTKMMIALKKKEGKLSDIDI